MFGWEFPPFKTGGLGTACYGLTKGLKNIGVEVSFVIPRSGGAEFSDHVKIVGAAEAYVHQEEAPDYSHVELVKVDVPLSPYGRPEHYFHVRKMQSQDMPAITASPPEKTAESVELYGKNLFGDIEEYTARASVIAEREEFDVIHAHDWMAFQAGLKAKKSSGKPLVIHVHATEYDRTGGRGADPVIKDIERTGAHESDRIIAVSDRTKKMLIRNYGVSARKVSVVYNAIDSNGYVPGKFAKRPLKRKTVLFLGRITVQKGPEYFLEAASKVLEKEPDTVFVMAGSGDMMYRMVEKACDLNIGHRVLFPGFVKGAMLDRAYDMADVYVMPSVSEPFGITPLEAMSHGVPVIISKQSGVSEVIKNALKVDFWDVDKFANGIIALLRCETLRGSLSKNGKSEIGRLNWDKSASHCVNVYEEALSKTSSKKRISLPMVEDPRRLRRHRFKRGIASGNASFALSDEHTPEIIPPMAATNL